MVAHEALVNIENQLRLGTRFHLALMNGVAFLPKEFGGAQKQTRSHLPADNVRPLVDEDRQITIRLHPFRVTRTDDCF